METCDFYGEDSRRLDPESELAAIVIADVATDRLDSCPPGYVSVYEFSGIKELVIDTDESDTGQEYRYESQRSAAFFDAGSSRTAVVVITDLTVDGDAKRLIAVSYYRGIPFGNIFEPHDDGQFEARPVTKAGSIVEAPIPLQSVVVVRDMASGAVSVSHVGGREHDVDDEIVAADFQSMQSWLAGADEPLQILDGGLD